MGIRKGAKYGAKSGAKDEARQAQGQAGFKKLQCPVPAKPKSLVNGSKGKK